MAAARFPLGRTVATPGALEALVRAGETPLNYLARHIAGDWGDLDQHDKAQNEIRHQRWVSNLVSVSTCGWYPDLGHHRSRSIRDNDSPARKILNSLKTCFRRPAHTASAFLF